MDISPFVFLSGDGAEKFAQDEGIEIVNASYFFTDARWQQLAKIKDINIVQLGNDRREMESTDIKAPSLLLSPLPSQDKPQVNPDSPCCPVAPCALSGPVVRQALEGHYLSLILNKKQ